MVDDQTRIEAIGDQLRGKISSKFQTTAFLAGFSMTLLGTEISMLWQPSHVPLFAPYSIAALVFSGTLYVAALSYLDGLTMPKRFWEEDKRTYNPVASRHGFLTDQDLWALQRRMVFYWERLVLVALGMTGLSLLLILVPQPSDFSTETINDAAIWCVVTVLFAVGYVRVFANGDRMGFPPMSRFGD